MKYYAGTRIGITMFGTAALACGTGSRPDGDTNAPRPVPASAQARRAATTGTVMPVDAVRLYQSMGLLADGAPVPFVGSVAFLAGKSADSTLALITLSIPNRSLTFGREGDQYQASYQVVVEVRRNGELLLRSEGTEQVRVPIFKETARTDESIIFQQLVNLPPGNGDITVTVRDEPTTKSSSASRTLIVPKLDASTLSTPVAFYEVHLAPVRTRCRALCQARGRRSSLGGTASSHSMSKRMGLAIAYWSARRRLARATPSCGRTRSRSSGTDD